MFSKNRSSLVAVLSCLTLLAVIAQIATFTIHYSASKLLDDFISSSISTNIFDAVVLIPIIQFIIIQILAYILFITFIWFISVSFAEFFQLSAYWLGIFFWGVGCLAILTLNNHYFPDSFFASSIRAWSIFKKSGNDLILYMTLSILAASSFIAYCNLIKNKRHLITGSLVLIFVASMTVVSIYNQIYSYPVYHHSSLDSKPNIIIIGLDSVRPDYTGYFGHPTIHTPHIDYFLKTAVTLTEAYTPLARTFPSWVSILTAKHPKNSQARINLGYALPVILNDTLAKRLKQAGYETIYATDEKRFSNITEEYGFDHILGPKMGLDDFLLGLSDFPLTNLMVNLPLGRFLFPYNYANRAAAITYEPDTFLQQIKIGLHQRKDKPLFLAMHFCVTHWPYTWAGDNRYSNTTLEHRYFQSIERVDKQLGELMQVLKEEGLLEHSLVILLSDHGTTLGMLGDRVIEKKNYQGDSHKLSWVKLTKLSTAPSFTTNFAHDYSVNTSYGQGTDVLSLKQYHILLAFKGYGMTHFLPHPSNYRSSLLDITPTVLAILAFPPMNKVDGESLKPYLFNSAAKNPLSRPLFLETGYTISEIETNDIVVEQVLKRSIGLYQVNPKNGYLSIKPAVGKSIIENKQRAVLMGDWLLARYPASTRNKSLSGRNKNRLAPQAYTLSAYYVLTNIKTGQWTIGFDSELAKMAPLNELRQNLARFYGDEV